MVASWEKIASRRDKYLEQVAFHQAERDRYLNLAKDTLSPSERSSYERAADTCLENLAYVEGLARDMQAELEKRAEAARAQPGPAPRGPESVPERSSEPSRDQPREPRSRSSVSLLDDLLEKAQRKWEEEQKERDCALARDDDDRGR